MEIIVDENGRPLHYNKRCKLYFFKGRHFSIKELSETFEIPRNTLYGRLERMSVEKAIQGNAYIKSKYYRRPIKEKPPISKELEEHRKENPVSKKNFLGRVVKKTLRYADYQKIEAEKKKNR